MPALTLWLFAAGGLALSAPSEAQKPANPTRVPVRVVAGIGCVLLALTPLAVLRSQKHLGDALGAFRAGDCPAAVRSALASKRALSSRPEPFELVTYCYVRAGRSALALRAADAAVHRDPGNWELRYAQAIARAASGRDPRSAAQAALRRNPHNAMARGLTGRFMPANRERWRVLARTAPPAVPGAVRVQRGRTQGRRPS
jgi:hypothetical protein